MKKHTLDKMIAESLLPLDRETLQKKRIDIENFIKINENKYYMLLSDELRYYTIFEIKQNQGFGDKVINFILNDPYLTLQGQPKYLELEGSDYIEIWIGEYYFSFFPCDSFMVVI